MAGIHFDITGDNSNFMQRLRETENGIRNTTRQIEQNGLGIEDMFGRMSKAAAGLGAAFSAQQFASQVMKVRGEFQQLEVAFNTMLGSAEKASSLMQQLTRTAAITPFGLQDVAGGAKQLLAYGVASENVNDTLIRLGDIAAGLSIPLNDLVYLYGTTMTQGRMFTQDLRQFQGRGIPLADELAKQFGVTKDKVGELVTAGKVGFDEMHKAIVSMTSDGGKFGGLMEAQSKTITGQISNIEDAIDSMFNEIGKSSEGAINAALGGVSTLVENWQTVADTIGAVVVMFGSYKAAVMTTDALNNVRVGYAVTEEIAGLTQLLGIKEQSNNADLEAAVASGRLTEAKAAELAALREEAQNRLAVLNLKKQEAAEEAKAALEAFNVAKQEKEAADERLENMQNLYEAALEQGDASYEAYATEQLQTASAAANSAATRLNTAEKNLNAASSKSKAASEAADTFATNANTVANHANTASMNIMKAAALQLQTILKGLWATLMANPLAIVAAAVGLLAYGIYQFVTRESAAEKVAKQFNDALEEQSKKLDEQKRKTDELISTLGNLELSEGTRIANFQALKQEYPDILKDINTENEFLKEKHKILQLINQEQGRQQQEDDKQLLQDAEDRLKHYVNFRKKYGKNALVDVDGNGWATDNVTEAINAEQEIVNQLKARIASREVESYLGNIKNLKDEDIVSTIEDITLTLQALEGAGDNAIGIVNSLGGEFSKSQLKTIKSALTGEQSARGGKKQSSSKWLKQYEQEYEAAKKALADFMKKQNELSETEFERQYKDLADKRDAAKKKYEDAGGSVKSDEKTSKKQKEAQKKLAEDLLAIQQKNIQDEIALRNEGKEKKLAQIDAEYDAQKKEIEKKAKELAETNKKAGVTGTNKDGLTKEQQAEIDKANKLNQQSKDKSAKEVYREELQALYDYLKEYGTIQQQKYAIAKEYDEKIAKEANENSRKSLEKQKENALATADANDLAMGIDWGRTFEGVGNVLGEVARETLKQVEDYMKTDQFKNLSPESKQSYTDLRDKLIQETGDSGTSPFNFKQWGTIAQQVREYQTSVKTLKDAQNAHSDAVAELIEAEENLKNATDEAAIEIAQKAVDVAQGKVDKTGQEVTDAQDKSKKAEENLTNSTRSATQGIQNFTSALNEMNNGSLYGFANGITKLVTSLSGGAGAVGKSLSELGKVGGIVGAILQVLDALGDDPKQFIDDLLASVATAIEKILTDLPNILVTIISRAWDIVGGVLSGIGSWFGLSGIGDSDKNLARDIERLTASNENLQDALDNLSEKLAKSSTAEATGVYEQQKANIQEQMRNTQEMMARSAAASSSGFLGIGGHHSTNYKINRGMSTSDWERISKVVGRTVTSASDFFNLTSEEMARVATEATDLYSKIESLADDGYKDASQYMDEYIEYYKQLEELENEWREKLTSASFDSIRDEFKSALLDMESTAEDFAENFEELMRNAIIESLMSSKYDKLIQGWYEEFAKAMEDGQLSASEKTHLQNEWNDIVDQGIAERDALFQSMGFDSTSTTSQGATAKGFETMSEDTATSLEGRFTALQMVGEEIKNQMVTSVELLTTMTSITSDGNVTLSNILNQHIITNSYLEDLVKYSKTMLGFGEKLDKIVKQTESL